MNVLITGGAGFIGANLAAHYLGKKAKVTVYDNLHRPGVKKNITWLKKNYPSQYLTVKIADILNYRILEEAVKGQHIIFHMAGQTAVTTSIQDPMTDFELNARGTLNLLEAVRNNSPRAVVVTASTNKVYGNLDRLKLKENKTRYKVIGKATIDESEPLDFHSPYGCSKGTADQYTRDYSRIYGIKTIVFRQSCIYGTHQLGVEDQGWLAHFAAMSIKKKSINIFGNGKQVRDALYINDLIQAYDKAVTNINTTAGNIYNIGGGEDNTVSLLELITLLEKVSGEKINTKFFLERPGDQQVFISDNSKAKKDFKWKPTTSVEDGVEKLYYWLKESLK